MELLEDFLENFRFLVSHIPKKCSKNIKANFQITTGQKIFDYWVGEVLKVAFPQHFWGCLLSLGSTSVHLQIFSKIFISFLFCINFPRLSYQNQKTLFLGLLFSQIEKKKLQQTHEVEQNDTYALMDDVIENFWLLTRHTSIIFIFIIPN